MAVTPQNDKNGMKQAPVKKQKRPGFFSRHVGITYFLITFGCCVAAFAALGLIIYYVLLPRTSPVSANSAVSGLSSSPSASSSASSAPLQNNAGSFTMLLIQYDDSTPVSSSAGQAVPAALTLLRLDADKENVKVMAVPVELACQYNSQPATLGSVYTTGGVQGLATALLTKTGIRADYTCAVPFSKLSAIMNDLSGFNYNVPYAVSYVARDQKVYSVNKGQQHLGGGEVEALIGSASYPGGTLQKYEAQANFLCALAKEKLSGVYLENAQSFYGDVFKNVTTGFQLSGLTNRQALFQAAANKGDGFSVITPEYTPTVVGQTAAFDYTTADIAVFKANFNAK